ncbi:short chain dehydrogenase [Methylocapsa palsarum]|uniref:Short chain dehydrogenase n=1 Tax=Methylocapsa palsarum TaxID=1612308 RepID=A0A1I4CX31_9HYPH|nr:short chain dehydrogenase [Methylocapsa palsarum]
MTKKFAIVTGASTGIGFELTSIAAENGYDLLVVADEPLIQSAEQNFARHGVDVRAIEADLSTLQGVDSLLAAAQGRQIDLLCANAGRGLGHGFLDQDVADWRRVIDTNITGTIYLLQKVLRDMMARDNGTVLITGSIAGFIPGAFQAVYNGTKAFVDSFADAIRNEIKERKGTLLRRLCQAPSKLNSSTARRCWTQASARRPARAIPRTWRATDGTLS